MKHTNKQLKIGALALVAGMYSAGVQSASTTIDATALILEPVVISNESPMDFGTIASGSVQTTISVDGLGDVTGPSGTGDALVTDGAGAALSFDIQAASGQSYTISLTPGSMESSPASGAPMVVNNLVHDDATESGTGATKTVTVTADLIVGADQPSGSYSTLNGASIAITADYQ